MEKQMIKIMLAVPTLNRLDRLTEMLQSVAASTRQPDRVLIVNNGKQVTDALAAEWSRQFELDVFTPVRNLGVAGSVNFALRNTPQGWHWIHVNDDVELDPRCIEFLASEAELFPPCPSQLVDDIVRPKFYLPEHGVGSAFTVFMVSYSFRGLVGYFSEVFSPCYFEDNDYGRRMNLIGVRRIVVKGAAYIHHTSSTLNAYTDAQRKQHHKNFQRNALEYERMWGGPPEHETFDVPYNGRFGHGSIKRYLWAVHEAPLEEDTIK